MNFYDKFAPRITHNGQAMLGPLPDLLFYYDGPEIEIQVKDAEAGRADLIAWNYLESRDPLLARTIKYMNGIYDGLTEIKSGDYLRIPVKASWDNFVAGVYTRNV